MSTHRDTQATSGAPSSSSGPNPSTHDDFHNAQQRFWTEWAEAGRLWMSWWMNSLPVVGWPPVGTVLPPTPGAPLPGAPLKADGLGKGSPESASAAAAPPKHARASGARHH